MESTDVVIVGGGMAGLSTALEISSISPLRVLVLEKERVGSNLTTPVVPIDSLQTHGLENSILQTYTGGIHDSPSGFAAAFHFEQVVSASIDYEKACKILLTRTINNGVRLLSAKALHWLPSRPDPTKPLVLYLEGGEQIQTEVLVDASGQSQWASRHLGIRGSNHFSHCFGEFLSGCSVEDQYSFRFLRPSNHYGNGGGWFYPTGAGLVSIGYSVVNKSPHPESNKAAEGYFKAKAEFMPYSDWVRSGKRERVELGTVPVGRIGGFVADRIAIVGDAAGQAHPWVVEGCRPALDNGKLCGRAVVSAFQKGCFSKAHLAVYEKSWNRVNRERFWRAASVADIQWNRSDEEWDRLLRVARRVKPEKMLPIIRDNHASVFQKAYAVAGYLRRGLMKCLASVKQSTEA